MGLRDFKSVIVLVLRLRSGRAVANTRWPQRPMHTVEMQDFAIGARYNYDGRTVGSWITRDDTDN